MFQKELDAITPVDIIDKYDALPSNKLQLQDDVGEEELVRFVASDSILRQVCCFVLVFFEFKNSLIKTSARTRRIFRCDYATGFRRTMPFNCSTSLVKVALIRKDWYTFGK